MKIGNKLLVTFGTIATVGLVCTVGVMASSTEPVNAAPAEKVVLSYGDTTVEIQETVEQMFSHKAHVVELGFECDSCHPDLFEKKRGAAMEKGDYTMASLEEGTYCGACHDGDTAFGVTDTESCVTCHGSNMEQPKTIVFTEPVKAVIFDHAAHVDMGMECASCHNDLFKMEMGNAEKQPEKFTMEALYAGEYCGACHNGDDAFASNTKCTTCHIGVKGFDALFGGPKAGGHH